MLQLRKINQIELNRKRFREEALKKHMESNKEKDINLNNDHNNERDNHKGLELVENKKDNHSNFNSSKEKIEKKGI